MGFFDLNIPYNPYSKSSSFKLAIKAMELGYSGVAFNHNIRTILSDLDRCPIALYSVPGILALDSSLASFISFHRNVLSVPQSTFRQYTRVTLAFERLSQASFLTGGNAVLKSYDIVAVQPLTQAAFDYACQTAEVDIISVDLAKKLPLLKLPMVKAAIERGVYFEISYSSLVTDVKARSQIFPGAKLLANWTEGQNLIISSSAPSVNEFRGPYDVANLLSLLGLSMEQAKAAISKNCRNLITSALRKKHYKENIRIQPVATDKKSNLKESLVLDSTKWDPISSSEGDLQLDDLAQSFLVTTKAPKTVKTTDFPEVTGGCQSHGNFLFAGTKPIEVPVVNVAMIQKPGCNDLVTGISQKAAMDIDLNSVRGADGKLDILSENPMFQMSVIDAESNTLPNIIMEGNAKAKCKRHKQSLSPSEHLEEQQHIDAESIRDPDGDSNVKDNSSIPSSEGKAKAKRKRHKKGLCPSEHLEEQQHGLITAENIHHPDGDSTVKGNSSIPSSEGKAKAKRKRHIKCLSPSEHLEEPQHGHIDTESISNPDGDSNVKDNSSDPSSERTLTPKPKFDGKAKAKRKRHKKSISSSEHLEEQLCGGIDAESIPDPDGNPKANSSIPSSEGMAKAKRKRHNKGLSPFKHLEEQQHGHTDAESIPDPDGDSNVKDNSSFPSLQGISTIGNNDESPVVS